MYEILVKPGKKVINPVTGKQLEEGKSIKMKMITPFWYRRQLDGEVSILEAEAKEVQPAAPKKQDKKDKGE